MSRHAGARRRWFLGAAALVAFTGTAGAQPATPWPSQPVRVVVPAPPGSSLDLIARALGPGLSAKWKQPVVVENKPGAGGTLGTDVVAKAAPDGHTMALTFNGPVAFAPSLYRKLPYDPARDLVPVVTTTSQPNVLAVNAAKVPAKTVAEFVAWARSRPAGITYASLGNGSSAHLTMELFLAEAGLKGVHVPFNGSPPAALALAQGEVDAVFMVAPALAAPAQAGTVRLLAASGAGSGAIKALPTLASAGYAVESQAWNGLFMPARTPDAVVQQVNADVNALLQDATVRATLDAQGLAPVGGSAAELARLVATERARWAPVITRLGVTLD